jgi:hypothetical protein
MGAVTITQMADRVASLMEARLGARGRGLDEKVKRAGRRLPRKVRTAAVALADAALMAQNPKLLVRVDEAEVAANYDICVRHLGGLNLAARRKGAVLNFAASVAFSVLVVGAGVLAYLVWRGYV